jgi:hypothetical protein
MELVLENKELVLPRVGALNRGLVSPSFGAQKKRDWCLLHILNFVFVIIILNLCFQYILVDKLL